MNTTNSKFSARLKQGHARDRRSGKVPAAERAAIEIQREQHVMKPDPKDILKAVFMWRDDPRERTNRS